MALFLAFVVLLLVRPSEAFQLAETGWLKEYDFDWLTTPAWLVVSQNETPSPLASLQTIMFSSTKPVLVAIQNVTAQANNRLVLRDTPKGEPLLAAATAKSMAETLDEIWAIQRTANGKYSIRSAREEGEYLTLNTGGNCKGTSANVKPFEAWILEAAPGTDRFYIRTAPCSDGRKPYLSTVAGKLSTLPNQADPAAAGKTNAVWEFLTVLRKS